MRLVHRMEMEQEREEEEGDGQGDEHASHSVGPGGLRALSL